MKLSLQLTMVVEQTGYDGMNAEVFGSINHTTETGMAMGGASAHRSVVDVYVS